METNRINSFNEFEAEIDKISPSALCRGVSNADYELIPSLFRHKLATDIDLRETNMMWLFTSRAKGYLSNFPESDLEWLTIAQHHGLPTRLLDWTLSPLVALFFAVCKGNEDDGAVYIYDIHDFKKESEIDLKSITDIVAFFPSHSTKRVTAQSGMFTVHPTNVQKLEHDQIKKIIVPGKEKRKFLNKLYKYGIHQASLFPGLDGIAEYIKFINYYI